MVHANNEETASTFVKVIQRKLLASFFPDTVYYILRGYNRPIIVFDLAQAFGLLSVQLR